MLRISLRRCVAVLVFNLAFVINPFYVVGCASDDDDEQRAAQAKMELLGLLDDVNGEGRFAFEQDGVEYELLLELTQAKQPTASLPAPARASFMSVAHACGNVTFYQSASACSTQYTLAVEGTFTLRRLGEAPETIATDVPVSGTLHDYGQLSLQGESVERLFLEPTENGAFVLFHFIADDLGGQSFDI
jgi:hypothetical protein